ncbi:MAG: glycerophosphodiester phosphodiesterase [Desulfobacteraceae bacterium]|nr:glycerophosphodiester phosphodiesterase [Desulfobacteraceae bacterium]
MIKKNKPEIIAHRGNCDGLPENSKTAIMRSIAYNVDGIETDVQLTKDNIPVIFHDRTSFKLTGSKKQISSYTIEELLQFNIESEKILTLTNLLELFSEKTSLYIEIKTNESERISGRSKLLTKKVIEQVLNIGQIDQNDISILSFDPDILNQVHLISNKIKCVLNLNDYDTWCIHDKDILNKKFDCNYLSGLCINKNMLTIELVNFAHKHNMKMFTYSCNTEKELSRLLNLNLDGIMTDKAEWLVKRMNNEARN